MQDPTMMDVSGSDALLDGVVSVDEYLVGLRRDQQFDRLQFFAAEKLEAGYRLLTVSVPLRDLPADNPLAGTFFFETPQGVYHFHHLINTDENTTSDFPERIDLKDGRLMHYQIELGALVT